MKYVQNKILLLFSVLTLFTSGFLERVQAQPLKTPQHSSVLFLPPQPSDTDLTIPLTYKLVTYNSRVMGGTRSYGVSLPPGYDDNQTQRYPVIFLLHGGHGNPEDWFAQKGGALKTLQKLYMTGKLPPSIVITPDGNDKRGSSSHWDPQYIDGPYGKVSQAVGDELVKVVKQRYRTLPSPDFWALGGLSSGGWGAMNVGLHNLKNFSILFSHSGYFKDKSGPQNSPIVYIHTISPQDKKRLRIYLDSGKSDFDEIQQAQQFSKVLSELRIYSMFRQFSGSHTWRYWREHLADSLTFVGEQFQIAQIQHTSDDLGFNEPTYTQEP
ncbi:alpha/beta hydrolase-fold protein [Aetokthonos hydrillicola Thurmond2011]|jgi:enterochelin esterase-like enzyme|uniref:Alpha/beta hydrolase-fold protein n=1 Tax=Aetokthonos hydrillicola Thurmond2011 TaxID=2712845 RepID=A0AAP5I526_9CYAN|nr:alpha/beta hydrolase-fold protein [Aetokthonos hydrillicola]MBW4590078.1 esterase family protein [Aetokthonos hydrillicola CCALA 1050]MDR9894869.1 alpha/beta hydrolase-fold protein [Aetokthonos hydrillicola Thurmond2011]